MLDEVERLQLEYLELREKAQRRHDMGRCATTDRQLQRLQEREHVIYARLTELGASMAKREVTT